MGQHLSFPMAERVAIREARERGIDLEVESFGISAEEAGNPIDRRAARTLTAHGYDASGHQARRVTADDLLGADLVVAVEPFQVERLLRSAPGARVALLNDFNPRKPKGEALVDPGTAIRPASRRPSRTSRRPCPASSMRSAGEARSGVGPLGGRAAGRLS
nr:hypothetical protein [Tessaracoccus coleopterorum]